jgi:hypothetical protein
VWQERTHTFSSFCKLVFVTEYAWVHVILYGLTYKAVNDYCYDNCCDLFYWDWLTADCICFLQLVSLLPLCNFQQSCTHKSHWLMWVGKKTYWLHPLQIWWLKVTSLGN